MIICIHLRSNAIDCDNDHNGVVGDNVQNFSDQICQCGAEADGDCGEMRRTAERERTVWRLP